MNRAVEVRRCSWSDTRRSVLPRSSSQGWSRDRKLWNGRRAWKADKSSSLAFPCHGWVTKSNSVGYRPYLTLIRQWVHNQWPIGRYRASHSKSIIWIHTRVHTFAATVSHDKLMTVSKLQSGWPNELSMRLPFWEIRECNNYGFESGACVGWLDLVSNLVESNDFKIDTCFLPSQVLGIIRIGKGLFWLSVRIIRLSGITDDGAGRLVFQLGCTIKLPWVHTITSRYPSWYGLCMLLGHKTTINKQTIWKLS